MTPTEPFPNSTSAAMSDPANAAPSDPDLSGRHLGDYQILRRLGRGGMAEVYLAEQQSLGRRVALKVLLKKLADDPAYVRRFLHEARAAASLVHANIVQIYEVGHLDDVHFIAQEYVDGLNLRQVLERRGPLDTALAANILRQTAAALQKSGGEKIVHRDIKPENILLSSNSEVKVADFGLARVQQQDSETLALTQAGVTMGTPLYMSPEQVEGRSLDARSDLYSLGVTCYHILAGRPPFEGDSAINVALQHLQKTPQKLEELRPDLPPGLCQIVHRLMAKEPVDRYQNAGEMLWELRELKLEGVDANWPDLSDAIPQAAGGAATQQLKTVMLKEKKRSQPRRVSLPSIALVAGCFLLGLLLALWTRPRWPLAVGAERQVFARYDSARQQFWKASLADTQEGWESLAKYFPPKENAQNRYYYLRAQLRLGDWSLRHRSWEQALESYQVLRDETRPEETELRGAGLVGTANVRAMQNEMEAAREDLRELSKLPQDVLGRLQQNLLPQLREEWRAVAPLRPGGPPPPR